LSILLDTHFALWLTQGGSNLSASERKFIAANAADLVVSAVSIWEVRLKWYSFRVSGARKGEANPADVLVAMAGMCVAILPLTAAHAATILQQALAHQDPFDELLLAQAQVEGLRLLTRDRELLGHPLAIGA
jgi:PIN domain nuclease of toxin-antitoxin system